jgi:hypothetical protein
LDSHLEQLHAEITSAIRGIFAGQLTRHPEGKWSAAEILEHLLYTYIGTSKAMAQTLEAGRPMGRRPTLKERLQKLWVVEAGHMPTGRSAPERTRPRGMSPQEVVSEIGPKILEMDGLITKCEVRYGRRALVRDHPILGPLTCDQWRKFHLVHGRHHARQIKRLRESWSVEGQ